MIITPAEIKKTHLAGVNLTDEEGVAFDDTLFSQAIESAQRTIELELGISLTPFSTVGERHDVIETDRQAFWPIDLDHRPVREVKKLQISLGNYRAVDLPVEWVNVLDADMGTAALIATSETMGSFFFASGMPILLGSVLSPYRYVPGYFSVDYDSGPLTVTGTGTIQNGTTSVTITHDRVSGPQQVSLTVTAANGGSTPTVTARTTTSVTFSCVTAPNAGDLTFDYVIDTVDPAIKDAVGCLAAIIPLATAGDSALGGAGIANYSIGVDGLSQSVSSTASAMFNAFSARVKDLRKQYDINMAALRGKYRRRALLIV